MTTFADPHAAAKLRDLMNDIAEKAVERMRPRPRQGQVQALDLLNERCSVLLVGESTPVTIGVPTTTTVKVGDLVRVAGTAGDRYIEGAGWAGGVLLPPPDVPDPDELVAHAVTVRIATTNPLGPSSADELEHAHIILDGSSDSATLNYCLSFMVFNNPYDTLRFLAGSGYYRLSDELLIPAGGTLIVEAMLPAHGTENSAHTNFWIGPAFPDDGIVFKTNGAGTNLLVRGVNVNLEPNIDDDTKKFQLTNCNLVSFEDVSAGQHGVLTRGYHPVSSTGSSILVARNTFLRGNSVNSLIRCGGAGTDQAGTIFAQLLIEDSVMENLGGGRALYFEAYQWLIQNTYLGAVGVNPCVELAFAARSVPPSLPQVMRGNRMVTTPASPGSHTPVGAPFLKMSNAVGAMVSDNFFSFENLASADDTYYPTTDSLVILDGGCRNNTLEGNRFVMASGSDFASGDGQYVPAKIELQAGSLGNKLDNLPQLLFDFGDDNEYPVEEFTFSKAGDLAVDTSGKYPVRRPGYLYEVVATLGNPGTDTTSFNVSVDGTVVDTFDIPSSVDDITFTIDHYYVTKANRIEVELISIGAGARSLVATVREH